MAATTTTVKLRTSCDSCQSIKVKCSQDHPECQRCAERGISCVYSPLRRLGRPRKAQITTSNSDEVSVTAGHERPSNERFSGATNTYCVPITTQNSALFTGGLDCYFDILTGFTQLESSLLKELFPRSIDPVLQVESDFRALKGRLFDCKGHGTAGSNGGRSCLDTGRPALLSLALYAERVVGLFEEASMQLAVAVTMSRAMRIGDFVMEPNARARTMGKVLQLRVHKTRAALEEMCESLQTGGGNEFEQGSRTASKRAALILIQDLMERTEVLQGRIALF